jgi:hypothetical protein
VIGCYEVSDIDEKETCNLKNEESIGNASPDRLLTPVSVQPRTFVKTDDHWPSLSCPVFNRLMDNMDVDTLFDMPGGDDFRNVTSVFSNAARG